MMLPNSQPIKTENIKIFYFDGNPVELASSKDVIISCDPAQEGGDYSYNPADLKMEWTVKATHKVVRQMRKFRKEIGLHKPRLPRKLKKKVKRFINEYIQFAMTLTKMKLPRYIKIKPYDDQYPAIVQTDGSYLIGAIMPDLNGSLERTAHKAKIYNYNLYVVFAGFFAPTLERPDIDKVLNEMAEFAYNEIVHPSFYGYKKNCENVEEELRLLKGEKAEKREAQKQEKFERVAQAIFKK